MVGFPGSTWESFGFNPFFPTPLSQRWITRTPKHQGPEISGASVRRRWVGALQVMGGSGWTAIIVNKDDDDDDDDDEDEEYCEDGELMKKEHFEAFLSEDFEYFWSNGDLLKPRICHFAGRWTSQQTPAWGRSENEMTKMGYSRDRSMLKICISNSNHHFFWGFNVF